jgi:anti-sigma B factor antagonist
MPEATVKNTLTFSVEHKGDVVLVHCRGRLVAGLCNEFYEKVKALIPGTRRVVLDLTDLAFVDSMGLGTLVRLNVSARSKGSCLELINLGKQIRELLGLTNLLSVFGDMCEKGVSMKF